MKRYSVIYLLAMLFVLPLYVRGQVSQSNTTALDKLGFSNNGVSGGINEAFLSDDKNPSAKGGSQPKDTTAKKKKKPLRSFYFTDSIHKENVFCWTVNPNLNTIERQQVDTLLDKLQLDYLYMKEELGSFSLGNLAGAALPINYFLRPSGKQFSFLTPWNSYILKPEDVVFYNSKVPYSRFDYEMSGQTKLEENICAIIFSANASPSTSFNFKYRSDGTKGMYMRQKGLDRYFTAAFDHTGERYAFHGGYIYNYGNIYENGGVKYDKDVTDTVFSSADQIDVRLKNSENTYRGNTFWWSQSYAIPLRHQSSDELTLEKVPTVFIGQSFNYTKFGKNYYAESDTALYKTCYIDDVTTDDTISQSLLDVNVFTQFQPYDRNGALGLISAGIGYERSVYNYKVPDSYVPEYGSGGNDVKSSAYIYGGIGGKVKKYAFWDANLKYYLTGYRSQDIDLSGRMSFSAYIHQKPLTLDLSASLNLTTPDYWAQKYFSNHYAWQNDFGKEKSLRFAAAFKIPSIGFELGANYELVTGKIYYDSISMPQQHNEMISVLGAYLQKNFKAGGFHFNHKILGQLTSNERVVPLPALSVYLSYYFEFNIVKNVLRLQTGIDGRYNTSYYAEGWNPALGRFYNQRELEIGGYPYLDFFVNAKWKRMLILIKVQHFNCNIFPKYHNYFQILHHPQNRMMLKFGFSWSFYD